VTELATLGRTRGFVDRVTSSGVTVSRWPKTPLMPVDPGPGGPGASWTLGLVDPGRRGRIPEFIMV